MKRTEFQVGQFIQASGEYGFIGQGDRQTIYKVMKLTDRDSEGWYNGHFKVVKTGPANNKQLGRIYDYTFSGLADRFTIVEPGIKIKLDGTIDENFFT